METILQRFDDGALAPYGATLLRFSLGVMWLAHEYENIDYRKLFKTATEDVPALILVIEPIVNAALG